MNVIDLFILLIMAVFTVIGSYNGAVLSALNGISFVVSWLLSLLFYPLISRLLMKIIPNFLMVISHYADGSSRIPDINSVNMPVSSFSSAQIKQIVNQAQIPNPFGRILISSFDSAGGSMTLAEYFDTTVAIVIINIVSFLLLFLALKLLLTIGISVFKTVKDIPILAKYDSLVGAGIGVIRGFFVAHFLFVLVPIMITIAPIDLITEMMDSSLLSGIFYKANMFTLFIR